MALNVNIQPPRKLLVENHDAHQRVPFEIHTYRTMEGIRVGAKGTLAQRHLCVCFCLFVFEGVVKGEPTGNCKILGV